VTSHIPLSAVAAAIDGPTIESAVSILDRSLRAAGVPAPRIGVAALNPHAGDGGTLGREQIEVIAPAVQGMRVQGVDLRGPLPADTVAAWPPWRASPTHWRWAPGWLCAGWWTGRPPPPRCVGPSTHRIDASAARCTGDCRPSPQYRRRAPDTTTPSRSSR